MHKTSRTLTALTATILGAGLFTAGTPVAAIAASEPLTITPTTSTAVLNGTGGVDLTYSMEVSVPEGTAEALTMKVFGGWPGGGVDPVRQSASNVGACAPASLPAPGVYTVTCTTTGEAPTAEVVDYVGSVEAYKTSQWGYPVTVGGAEVVARYTASAPPVVDPPVVKPPVVEPPVVEPPVLEPPVGEPPVVEPPVVEPPVDVAATATNLGVVKRASRAFTVHLSATGNTPVAGAIVKVKVLKRGKWKQVGTYTTNIFGVVKVKTKAQTRTKYRVTVVSVPDGFTSPTQAAQTVTVKPAKKATQNR